MIQLLVKKVQSSHQLIKQVTVKCETKFRERERVSALDLSNNLNLQYHLYR